MRQEKEKKKKLIWKNFLGTDCLVEVFSTTPYNYIVLFKVLI